MTTSRIYRSLQNKYKDVDERVYVSDGITALAVKTLSDDAVVIVDELLILKDVFGEIRDNGVNNRLEIIVELDSKLYGELGDYVNDNCKRSEKQIYNRRMPTPGIDIYEVDDEAADILVSWRHKAFVITKTGSNSLVIVIDSISGEFHGLIKHLGTAPFVLSGKLHLMHGSSIHYNDKNIIIAAESGHGKTTFGLLFGMNGGALISEDISYILGASDIINTGSKNYITVRKGTLYAFREYFKEYCTEDDVDPKKLYLAGEDESIRFGLDIIDTYNDSGTTLEKMDIVIVPEIDGDFKGYEISELNSDEINEINRISNRDYNTDWLTPFTALNADTVELRNNCRIRGVRYVRLHTGFDYRDYFDNIITDLMG